MQSEIWRGRKCDSCNYRDGAFCKRLPPPVHGDREGRVFPLSQFPVVFDQQDEPPFCYSNACAEYSENPAITDPAKSGVDLEPKTPTVAPENLKLQEEFSAEPKPKPPPKPKKKTSGKEDTERTVTVSGEYVMETAKAYLIKMGGEEIWFPKSRCDLTSNEEGEDAYIDLPAWLANKKGLNYD